MQFKDQAALDAYVQHPTHQALLKWLVPPIHAIELDLRAGPKLVAPASSRQARASPP